MGGGKERFLAGQAMARVLDVGGGGVDFGGQDASVEQKLGCHARSSGSLRVLKSRG